MKTSILKHTTTISFLSSNRKMKAIVINLFLLLLTFFNLSETFAQNTFPSKADLRTSQKSNKTKQPLSVQDFSIINSYLRRSNASSVTITEDSGYGISRTSLDNSAFPAFCLNFNLAAPDVNDTYNSSTTIANLSTSKQNKVKRIISLLVHPNYAQSPLPSGTQRNFYYAIARAIWYYTNNKAVQNYSWTGNDGNTYNTSNIITWVNNNTLPIADVHWLIPTDGSHQPLILYNPNCQSADNTTSDVSISEGENKTLSGTPAGGTWSIVSGGGSINGLNHHLTAIFIKV